MTSVTAVGDGEGDDIFSGEIIPQEEKDNAIIIVKVIALNLYISFHPSLFCGLIIQGLSVKKVSEKHRFCIIGTIALYHNFLLISIIC